MSTTTYRIILTVLGLIFIAIVLGAVLFAPTGDSASLPPAVDRFEPGDGDLVLRPAKIVLDLQPGYRAHLTIDDVAIPDDEVHWTEATGLHVYEPGPGSTLEEWTPGFHVVYAEWDVTTGLPDPGTLRWSFRVQ